MSHNPLACGLYIQQLGAYVYQVAGGLHTLIPVTAVLSIYIVKSAYVADTPRVCSSFGRAPASHAGGTVFDSLLIHFSLLNIFASNGEQHIVRASLHWRFGDRQTFGPKELVRCRRLRLSA